MRKKKIQTKKQQQTRQNSLCSIKSLTKMLAYTNSIKGDTNSIKGYTALEGGGAWGYR